MNARFAAFFFLNPLNMHHCSSLCSVSWLLMSGYLRYPRENPSFSLFRELSNLSFREETGVSEAFDIVSSCPMDSGIFMSEDTWCKQDLNIHYIPQLDMSVGHCIKKCTVSPPPLFDRMLSEWPPSVIMFVAGYGGIPAGTVKPQSI